MSTLICRLSTWVKKPALIALAMLPTLSGAIVDSANAATQILDQSFPFTSPLNPGGDEYQTLTVGITGQLTQADVFLTAFNDAPSMEIYSADSEGNLLAALTAAPIEIPFFTSHPSIRVSVDLTAESIHVNQGDVIAIVLREDNRPVLNDINYRWTWAFHNNLHPGATYEHGEAFLEVGVIPGIPQIPPLHNRQGDYGFETFVIPVPEPLTVHMALAAMIGLFSGLRGKRATDSCSVSDSLSRRTT